MSTNISINISDNETLERAIRAIVAITGEDASKLANKTPDEIFQSLSFLLKCKKEKLMELLKEHDQNKELDFVSLLKMWRLVSKGKVPNNKRQFKALDQETYTHLKILFARKGDEARYRADNHLGSATSDVNDSSVSRKAKVSKLSITPLIKSDGLKMVLDKVEDRHKIAELKKTLVPPERY